MNNKIFITGGTGYIGSRIIPELIKNNFEVTALVRKGSESKIPNDCKIIFGNALDRTTYEKNISPSETFIHLVGYSNPLIGKEKLKSVDLVSIEEAVPAALNAGVKHFIYLSVAHPAPIMKDYIEIRMHGEQLLTQSGMNVSFIRPWYVLGPKHYWPYLLIPFYEIFELIPTTREMVKRLRMVEINQMLGCLTYAVQHPPNGIRVYDVKDIKKF